MPGAMATLSLRQEALKSELTLVYLISKLGENPKKYLGLTQVHIYKPVEVSTQVYRNASKKRHVTRSNSNKTTTDIELTHQILFLSDDGDVKIRFDEDTKLSR